MSIDDGDDGDDAVAVVAESARTERRIVATAAAPAAGDADGEDDDIVDDMLDSVWCVCQKESSSGVRPGLILCLCLLGINAGSRFRKPFLWSCHIYASMRPLLSDGIPTKLTPPQFSARGKQDP